MEMVIAESTKRRKRDPNVAKTSPIKSHLESLADLKGEHVRVDLFSILFIFVRLLWTLKSPSHSHWLLTLIQVAARIPQKDGETDEWVVVKVIHFDKEREE